MVNAQCTGCFNRRCPCGGGMVDRTSGVIPAALVAFAVAAHDEQNRKADKRAEKAAAKAEVRAAKRGR